MQKNDQIIPKVIPPQAQNTAKTGKWDTFYSTYYWNIILDPKHPTTSTPVLTGYSKMVGQNEANDKDQLLKRKIINLFLNGYYKRMLRIEFFMRTEFMIDKKRDPKILIIYPTHYDIPEQNHDVIFKRYGSFLKEFFERVNKNISMDNILPNTRKLTNTDDFLDVEKQNFRTVAHLYAHASRCLIHGHAPGQVEAFIMKYKALKNW